MDRQEFAYQAGRIAGRWMVAAAILLAVMWAAEAKEVARIDLQGAMRHVVEQSNSVGQVTARDCGGDLQCLRRLYSGIDLSRWQGMFQTQVQCFEIGGQWYCQGPTKSSSCFWAAGMWFCE